MKKIIQIVISIILIILSALLFGFVSYVGYLMRWVFGSPLIPGSNWTRWNLPYLVLGELFCVILFITTIILIIISFRKKNAKILLIPFLLIFLFIIISIGLLVISESAWQKQQLESLDKELQANPKNSSVIEDKAKLYANMGEYDKAIELFNEALPISSNPAYTIHDRGMVYVDMEDYDAAISDFTKAMEMNPNETKFISQWYNDRGAAYFYKGEYEKSCQDAKKALEMGYNLNPGFLSALKSKGCSI